MMDGLEPVGSVREIDEQKRAALGYLADAFEEARLDGVELECMAQAALFVALKDLVDLFGEKATAEFAARLPDRIEAGEFSVGTRQ